ncbi:glycosyltransferase [Pedobacter sp.]|jgi:GT2 family glycosyltransferase|uniref:glycosyltransferase n=1 Tax=Pedobacter sp. TaxID=1411316 RepID=UPI002C7E57F6|nr:glycosyltransferase [Pedobacter sp.]HWW41767.1 glycosyltransferase [Pedobacter sp.]
MGELLVKDILIVVVIYNTPLEESLSLISLDQNCLKSDVFIYDNSLISNYQNHLVSFRNLNIKYVHDATNPGVSKAYNTAADFAFNNKKKLLLLLDQDTCLPENGIKEYLKAVNANPKMNLFAPMLKFNDKIYSPCNYYIHRGSHKKQFNTGVNSLKYTNFLNSGLLIKVDAFFKVKGYDENIRLYFSDFEFVNRFKKEYQEYYLVDMICNHELSSTDMSDAFKALQRFKIYCEDAKRASKSISLRLQYFITLSLRAVKLSLYFKDLKFIMIFFSDFI